MIRRFEAGDVSALLNHGGQEYLTAGMDPAAIARFAGIGQHFTVEHPEAGIIGCLGILPISDIRGACWALLQGGKPQYFVSVHRAARQIIDASDHARLEAYIDPTFPAAVRWVKILGFRVETAFKPLFFPDGRAAAEWVMIR